MNWILPEQKDTDLIDWIMKSRNITDKETFFNPTLSQLHDPFLIYGMEKAVEVILNAIKSKKKIFIHGDFDVDGITATSLLWQFLYRDLHADVIPYIPSRFDEGYGLSDESVQAIIAQGADIIITVDCGVKDLKIISKYKDKVGFVITDHHTILSSTDKLDYPESKIVGEHIISKDALAVVHPLLNNSYPFPEICGAAVAWKLCSALNIRTGNKVDVNKYLDLAALGTVCDIMPLVDENRIIVKFGLEQFKKTENIGLQALIDVTHINKPEITAYHLGYIIGPRLNASGRLKSAMDAVRLITTESYKFAYKIALELDALNKERQDLTLKYVIEAEKQLSSQETQNIIFVHGEEWPEGIIGLIAGRLTQKYNRPALVGSDMPDGTIKGSARSIEALNIAATLKLLKNHLLRYGGHAGAAGFTLQSSALLDFQNELKEIGNSSLKAADLEEKLLVDGIADAALLDIQYIEQLSLLEPFGHKNREPLIAVMNLTPISYSFMGRENQHIKFTAHSKERVMEFIAFEKSKELSPILSSKEAIDVAGTLGIDSWKGHKKMVFKTKAVRLSTKS